MCIQKSNNEFKNFVIHKITDYLYAVEEPTYYQGNFSYLIVGYDKALMFDAGASTTDDITTVIKSVTDKPFAVLPSHLHFDHIGGLKFFEEVYLPNLDCLKKFINEHGNYDIPDEFHLGSIDGFKPEPIKPKKIIQIGEQIDLGGISFQVLHAPGHSQDSIILYSPSLNICLLGDVLYPSELYVGNVQDYEQSLSYINSVCNNQTKFFGAHPFTTSNIPVITQYDLQQTLKVMQAIHRGEAEVKKVKPSILVQSGKRHCVNEKICIYTDIVFKNGLTLQYSA